MNKQFISGFHAIESLVSQTGFYKDDILYFASKGNPRAKKILYKTNKSDIQIKESSYSSLNKLVGNKNHQGIVLERYSQIELKTLSVETITNANQYALYIVFDGIQDPQNAGSIIRSMAAFNVSGLILPKKKSVPLGSTVWKVSSGTLIQIPILRVSGIASFLFNMKDENVITIGTSLEGEEINPQMIQEIKAENKPVLLVLGSEDKGISHLVSQRCERLVKIPQTDRVQSLNVANSASIFMYEFYK